MADQAGVLTAAQRADLESNFSAYEANTSQRIIVATVGKLNGMAIEAFASRAALVWQLGNEAQSNYILVILAPNDGRARIEPGASFHQGWPGKCSTCVSAVRPK
jgi:uncharacterized protein